MKTRLITSVLVNVVGILVPMVFIYLKYGGEHRVQGTAPGAVMELLVLAGAAIFSFLSGLLSSLIMKKATPTLHDVLRDAMKDDRAPAG